MTKQIHLAAHFPGVNNTTVWSDPAAGSHIEFDSFRQFAQTAERGKFDFLFLAEGLRLREQNGLIYDLDVVGRPDTFTILAALAAVTEHLGLTGTINSTFNEPYEVARQFASLDHLSGGRAAWNVVTSWDAFTGENFRRGGYLAQGDRYERARTFLATANELWDSWHGDEILADTGTGQFLATAAPGAFRHQDAFFDIAGQFNVPRSPQGRPVIFQAGDSDEGRDFAAASADAIFSRHSTLEAGQAFYADVKGRLPRFGRTRGELLILPAATFVLGDTDAEAAEIAREVRRAQVSPQTALKFIEQLWNTELSGFDVDGPLPAFDPVVSDNLISKGRASVRQFAKDPVALANEWRARAEAGNLSAREVVIEVTGRQSFIGSPETIATTINELVQADAADGYILVPHITPGGLAPFVDKVVPLLQERGVFRADYTGTTLRDHLGLAPLAPPAARRRPPGPPHEVHHHHADRARPGPAHGRAEIDPGAVPGGDRQRAAGRGTRLRRLRGRGTARAAVHLLLTDRGAQPHRRPDHAHPAVHRGHDAVAARPGPRVRGLRHPRPPLRRPA